MARFQKGQSGNPGGRPKEEYRVKELAREHTEAAIKTLADIMLNSESDTARGAAASHLLDRGWGKPSQAIVGEDGGPAEFLLMYEMIKNDNQRGLPNRQDGRITDQSGSGAVQPPGVEAK